MLKIKTVRKLETETGTYEIVLYCNPHDLDKPLDMKKLWKEYGREQVKSFEALDKEFQNKFVEEKQFKIYKKGLDLEALSICPDGIPWSAVKLHETIVINHYNMTLEKLNDMGGLGPLDLYAVLNDRSTNDCFFNTPTRQNDHYYELQLQCIKWINKYLAEYKNDK